MQLSSPEVGWRLNVFFGGGAPFPFLKALRCCGGAALFLRKEWRAAGARISLVVRRRCCPSSALELKKRRAANACEAGPRRLAMSPHLWMGTPHVSSWRMWQEGQPLCRGGKGARHTHNLSSPRERLPTRLHRSLLFSFCGGTALPPFFFRGCGAAAVLPSFCGRSGVLPKSA